MNIAIVTDEISKGPDEAIQIGTGSFRLQHYELRMIHSSRVPDISASEADFLVELKQRHGLVYTMLGAGLFKCPPSEEEMEHQLHCRLERAIALAHKLDIRVIGGFALHVSDNVSADALRQVAAPYFKEMLDRLDREGLEFAVETEFLTGCEVADDILAFRELVGPSLLANWDPANAWIAGEDPLDGYRKLRGIIANIHVKDADTRDWRSRNPFVPLSRGLVPWERLIPLLAKDPSISTLTVETHIEPLIANSEYSLQALRNLLDQEEADR